MPHAAVLPPEEWLRKRFVHFFCWRMKIWKHSPSFTSLAQHHAFEKRFVHAKERIVKRATKVKGISGKRVQQMWQEVVNNFNQNGVRQ